ncbi:Uu.00g091800.m01.CDS01 [Anthostomella pinea]|uniref:Uu.00g091800.m01.CDS01 n=1 Tax=Anthostomella pinea TaxID=933095 RepID=A0AAI8YI03_9PEZI|nr:Uu.00g091800.m01.CDS01 [Anthostomella pinea]
MFYADRHLFLLHRALGPREREEAAEEEGHEAGEQAFGIRPQLSLPVIRLTAGEDDEIKRLQEQVAEAEKRGKAREEEPPRRSGGGDLGRALERSGTMIKREYDEGFERLGRRYAMGDTITENQLQAQIIALQQTVISVLQEALANDRSISRADMQRLMLASSAAREGSLDALRQQYQRLTTATLPPQRALPPPKRASTIIEADSLFCRYSLDLQYVPKKPLSASFAPGGDGRCPECRVRLDVEPSDTYWHIEKRAPIIVSDGRYEEQVMEEFPFHLGQRFIVKCHTEDGEYACVLCNKYRSVDVVCGSVETLVNHVGKAHDVSELQREPDLRERPVPQRALPPMEQEPYVVQELERRDRLLR